MQINFQPIEKRVSEPLHLDIVNIFYTIQGEGPYVGRPAIFIRLAGCNLQCPGCDTNYTDGRKQMHIDDILYQVCNHNFHPNRFNPVVVITGGEPFRQNINTLAFELLEAGYVVQVETNGLLPIPEDFPTGVTIVCSPKTSEINRKNLERISALKYVIHADSVSAEDGLPVKALNHSNKGKVFRPDHNWFKPIYVQPMDCQNAEQNERNVQAAVKSCLDFGYTLQLQIHKLVGVE